MLTYLDKPRLLVFVFLVHVQLGELHLQVQGLDAHEDGSTVRWAWSVVDLDAWPTHGQGLNESQNKCK